MSPVIRASAASDSASLTADTMSAGWAVRRAAQKSTSASDPGELGGGVEVGDLAGGRNGDGTGVMTGRG